MTLLRSMRNMLERSKNKSTLQPATPASPSPKNSRLNSPKKNRSRSKASMSGLSALCGGSSKPSQRKTSRSMSREDVALPGCVSGLASSKHSPSRQHRNSGRSLRFLSPALAATAKQLRGIGSSTSKKDEAPRCSPENTSPVTTTTVTGGSPLSSCSRFSSTLSTQRSTLSKGSEYSAITYFSESQVRCGKRRPAPRPIATGA